MNKKIDEFLAKLLKEMFWSENNTFVKTEYSDLPFGTSMKLLKKREVLREKGSAIDEIMLLLKGSVRIVFHSKDGKEVLLDILKAPQILGLIELVSGYDRYSATIIADNNVKVVMVDTEYFATALEREISVCSPIIHYLSTLAIRNMNRLSDYGIYNTKNKLIIFIYQKCKDKSFPCTISVEKKLIASELYINLRSLYRCINELYIENFLSTARGKIVITAKNYENIYEHVSNLEII